MANERRLNMALTAFGLPHVMGYLPTKAGERAEPALDAFGLMDTACELALGGIEIPLASVADTQLRAWADALEQRGLAIVADLPVSLDADVKEIRGWLSAGAALGAKVMRATLSSLLCGDRRGLQEGWGPFLERRAGRLLEVLPHAEDLGICLALENHQDATSADLLRLGEMVGHSPAYGVTLDTGNPLAVAEDPVAFTRRVAALVRHVHLKDYTLHFAPEGFRLVRCAAGDGVVDFAAILAILASNGHALLPGIEIAAQQARTIPLLAPDWWACHSPTQASHLLPVLDLLWKQGRPANEPYATAWERGEGSAQVQAEEWHVLRRSVAYFRDLQPMAHDLERQC
jgi:3-oxoisoapionate decarboxylase